MRPGRFTTFALVLGLALAAAFVAGYVIDGVGRPALGFWAAFWGITTFAVVGSIATVLRSRRSWVRRAAKGVLGLTLGFIAYGALWVAIAWGPVSPFTLEGAWLWPLGLTSLAGAIWAIRGAVAPRR